MAARVVLRRLPKFTGTPSMCTNALRCLTLAFTTTALAGCASDPYFKADRLVQGPESSPDTTASDVRALPMFAGHDGRPLGWADLMDAVAWADIIILGEQHDDETGHAVQHAVVADTFARWRPCALSLEMLERDEQPLVSDYFEGIIDADQFKRLTNSEGWGRDGVWERTYQEIIDAARTSNGRVVAANAPRRYVRLARLEGYDRLAAIPSPRRQLFDYPARLPEGRYRDRFWTVMQMPDRPEATEEVEGGEDEGAGEEDAGSDESTGDEDAAGDEGGAGDEDGAGDEEEPHVMTDEEVEAIFHSQLVWDTTMATSIARAWRLGAKKVVHLIGQFHTDFEGGTVLELRKRVPEARVLVVSMQRAMPSGLLEDDRGRADIVIYTGERPVEDEEDGDGDADADGGGDASEDEDMDAAEPTTQPSEGAEEPATQPAESEPASTQPETTEPPSTQPADGK